MLIVDTTYDVRADSRGGDPDNQSKTLRQFHKALWSKYLPGGKMFTLSDGKRGTYLYHSSEIGDFTLSSDSIVHTYQKWVQFKAVRRQMTKRDVKRGEYFYEIAHTIGGYILFPSNTIDGSQTINRARGLNSQIRDRFDLTLECIRLYYDGKDSPLYDTLLHYESFFSLFRDFRGYAEYFLLQDITNDNYSRVRFLLPFHGFDSSYVTVPMNLPDYREYMEDSIRFVTERNKRINTYCAHA